MGNRRLFTALATTLVGLSLASPAAAEAQSTQAQASQTCVGADTKTTSVRRLQRAIHCLHNVERRKAGLSTLSWNRNLTAVARKYSRTMVARHFFSHYSAGRRDHMDRIATSRYTPSVGCWTAGENLYSSVGSSTPRQMMAAWMGSRTHRQNILYGGWHDFGLGVTKRSTDGAKGGLTVVALFGLRTGRPC
jgi:uncharacterized protein YkwD